MPERGTNTPLPGGGRGNARFRALMMAIVPEAAMLDSGAWHEAEHIIARALAARSSRVRRQLTLFVLLLEAIALVRHRRRLLSVAPADRYHLLESLSRSRFILLRRGVWGIRTLALMGYYARPAAARAIGYRASPGGWSTRREPTERP